MANIDSFSRNWTVPEFSADLPAKGQRLVFDIRNTLDEEGNPLAGLNRVYVTCTVYAVSDSGKEVAVQLPPVTLANAPGNWNTFAAGLKTLYDLFAAQARNKIA